MTIELPQHAQSFVEAKLASGQFADEAAVITYMLDRWQQWEQQTAEVRARVEAGMKAADEGRGTMISGPEEARAFAEQVKAKARNLHSDR